MRPFTKRRAPALFLGLSLATLATAAALAQSTQTPAAEPLRCEVALDAIQGGTRIQGRVISATPVSGRYDLQITSRMGGGRSSIRQSGEFTTLDSRPLVLGETEMLGAPASHAVELELRIGTRRLSCTDADL